MILFLANANNPRIQNDVDREMNDFTQGIGDDEGSEAFPTSFETHSDVEKEPVKTEPTVSPSKQEGSSSHGDSIQAEKTGSSVYIANLQWWTTDADVERLCSTYGHVVNMNFLAERSNGKSKGVVLVEFADNQAAVRCKEGLHGCNIHGRNCIVTFPNQSFRGNYGGRFGYYDRGRIPEGRGRGRPGRGYIPTYDARPGMGMHMMGDVPGYVHDMGMDVMQPEMMGMPSMEGHVAQQGPGYVPPPPYPITAPGGGYMHEESYEHPYFKRSGEHGMEHGMDSDDFNQKRQRSTS